MKTGRSSSSFSPNVPEKLDDVTGNRWTTVFCQCTQTGNADVHADVTIFPQSNSNKTNNVQVAVQELWLIYWLIVLLISYWLCPHNNKRDWYLTETQMLVKRFLDQHKDWLSVNYCKIHLKKRLLNELISFINSRKYSQTSEWWHHDTKDAKDQQTYERCSHQHLLACVGVQLRRGPPTLGCVFTLSSSTLVTLCVVPLMSTGGWNPNPNPNLT